MTTLLSWLKKNTPPQVKLSDKTDDSSEDERNESKQHTPVVQDISEKQPDSQNIPDQLNNQPNELSGETLTDKLEGALTQHFDKGNEQSESQFNIQPNEQSEEKLTDKPEETSREHSNNEKELSDSQTIQDQSNNQSNEHSKEKNRQSPRLHTS
jgi:hypothetical protein